MSYEQTEKKANIEDHNKFKRLYIRIILIIFDLLIQNKNIQTILLKGGCQSERANE